MSGIRLSQKHGVNPSVQQCFICGEDIGVILFGRLKQDAEAPHRVCLNAEPCDKCKGFMKQGIILISVKAGSDPQNPYRTGGWCVVREEAAVKIFNDPEIVKKRVAFVTDEAWDKIGLPRENIPEHKEKV